MEILSLYLTPTPTPTINPCLISPTLSINSKFNGIKKKKKKVLVIRAAKNEGGSNDNSKRLSEWDLMELKFGRMLGEDPDLTIAKIKGRKMNPDASYLEIEKNFYKNKGKLVETKEVPFEVPARWGSAKTGNGLNLVKPVSKKGVEIGGGESSVKLPEIKRPNELTRNRISRGTNYGDVNSSELLETKKPDVSSGNKTTSVSKSKVPNVILRKPSSFNEKDDEGYDSARLRIKPNLSLSMRTEPVLEKFGGMTLLKKPDSVNMNEDNGDETKEGMMNESIYCELDNFEDDMLNGGQSSMSSSSELELLQKPKAITPQDGATRPRTFRSNGMAETARSHIEDSLESKSVLRSNQDQATNSSNTGTEIGTSKTAGAGASGSGLIAESVLQGKPSKLDRTVKEFPRPVREDNVSANSEDLDYQDEQDNLLLSRPLKEVEENDWTRLEQHFVLRDRVDVELISCSPRGFMASFGSLIGFLPYRNLAAKWKFLAFESWLRKNGLDPYKYRQNLGIVGNNGVSSSSSSSDTLFLQGQNSKAVEVTPNMELEDLLRIYDEEKMQYLSSYVGEQIKVNILLADRKSRKLIFSMRPKEKEESIERKRSLMAKLSIGDVVKCCIKKITYFGIFVEVEGVPALIHQTEISWDATLDPSSYLKIGQIVDAKVHQLDFALERIFLSLKEISPDPLNEALECIVGNNSFNGGLQAAQADLEWVEVDSLIKELQKVEGVQMVTKGRFFLSPGLAPTFQVYMASMFENQYKLLARSGNKVQEVMVETSMDKEDMKSVILNCTNRVQL